MVDPGESGTMPGLPPAVDAPVLAAPVDPKLNTAGCVGGGVWALLLSFAAAAGAGVEAPKVNAGTAGAGVVDPPLAAIPPKENPPVDEGLADEEVPEEVDDPAPNINGAGAGACAGAAACAGAGVGAGAAEAPNMKGADDGAVVEEAPNMNGFDSVPEAGTLDAGAGAAAAEAPNEKTGKAAVVVAGAGAGVGASFGFSAAGFSEAALGAVVAEAPNWKNGVDEAAWLAGAGAAPNVVGAVTFKGC